MEAHGELLLRLYTQARGRGAEFYGESYLDSDRWVRINGIPERGARWASAQSAEFAPLLAAFAAWRERVGGGEPESVERTGAGGAPRHPR